MVKKSDDINNGSNRLFKTESGEYKKLVLDNGLRLALLPISDARSASVGAWVTAGSRHETMEERGISHFIEHMMFKGTEKRTARQISEEMDMLGGGMNAYTSKELTRYYAQTLGENAENALELICDMLMNSRFASEELELEKGVILDEIAMYEDSGEDVAHEAFAATAWDGFSAGRPIIGVSDTVKSFNSESLFSYTKKHYTPDRIIVVVAGKFNEDGIVDLVSKTLGSLPKKSIIAGEDISLLDVPTFSEGLALRKKDFEQTTLVVGMPGISISDKRRYTMMLLNFIVGGGISSRLFQRIREELGLAYSVYSGNYAASGAGLFTVTANFSANQQEKVLFEVNKLLDELAGGVSEEEFMRANAQVRSSFIMGLETVGAKATYVGRNEIYEGRQIESDEVMEILNSISIDEVNRLAADLINSGEKTISVAGDIKEESFYKDYLK